MKFPVIMRSRAFRSVLRFSNAPAILAVLVIALAWTFAEYQNRKMFEQEQRADVLGHVSLIRAKLEGNINSNIQLVRGLVATLSTEPDMDQQRFAALSANLLKRKSQLSHIAAAPGLVVSLMYPLAGNEEAIGLDYNRNEAQREAALRARDAGELILAGPVNLVQGGQGFIGRFPVFTEDGNGRKRFWGIVSAVVDVGQLYADSGMLDPDLPIEIALSGRDGLSGGGTRFYGAEATVTDNPVEVEVLLPSGSWLISARPKGGWSTTPPNIWRLRALIFAAGALIVVPTFLAGRLIDERQKNIRELKRRELQLERVSRRLGLALKTSQVGTWEMNLNAPGEFWDDRMNEIYGYPMDGGERDADHWTRRLHPDDLPRAQEEFRVGVAAGSYVS